MVKYTDEMMKKAKSLFPENREMHEMIRMGDPKVVDMLYKKIGFYLDEDDIIKAFRNKKEMRILDMAKRAKAIRELYQQMMMHVDKMNMNKADKLGHSDCM
jgi:glutaredoxin 2